MKLEIGVLFVNMVGSFFFFCDHKFGGKVYHPVCVGKKNTALKYEGR